MALSLNCLTVAIFLTRTADRAAAQSTKAKVAPFHTFILERGGALKLCGDTGRKNAHMSDVFVQKPSIQPATFEL